MPTPPFKSTPLVTGKDAERFEKALLENKNKSVSREEYDRAMAALRRQAELSGRELDAIADASWDETVEEYDDVLKGLSDAGD